MSKKSLEGLPGSFDLLSTSPNANRIGPETFAHKVSLFQSIVKASSTFSCRCTGVGAVEATRAEESIEIPWIGRIPQK
jgi:hypothetical protein